MKDISKQKLRRLLLFRYALGLVILGSVFFLTAGTFDYWHAWVLLAIFFIPWLFVSIYLVNKNPALIQRRMRLKEQIRSQKLYLMLATPIYCLIFIIPGFDFRFQWSTVPIIVVILANIFVMLGYIIIFLVFRENTFASRIVEVEEDQKVISNGPYALVRHPMYAGIILMFFFCPLALGSWWAMIPAVIVPTILVIRIRDEERFLKKELPGYCEYIQKVKYRLLPKVW
jgi:protein-S-isoprenylcysteine O-methyltransferase Ste14